MPPPLIFHPPVIAHRGARASAPENTIAALRRAQEEGAPWIEVDVKLTRDGVPILMHDDTLDRTTSGKGPVAEMDWADIQALDAGSWFSPAFAGERVPHLSEALKCALDRRLRVNLEIKPCAGRARVTTMVMLMEAAKIWPQDRPLPLISSMDIEALCIASQFMPHWPRGLLLDEWRDDWRDIVQKVEASTLNINSNILSKERMRQLSMAELPVLAYTVNEPGAAKELFRSGVVAVFSDNPRDMIAAL